MNYQKFPFGKYKGLLLNELPTNYIVYALEEFDLPDELTEDLKYILVFRLNLDITIETSFVKSIYRTLSKKYHPDSGGTSEAFNAVNEFYTNLLKYGK